jgi:prepilin-type N-terminal cleavage/methylation domain-containing protein
MKQAGFTLLELLLAMAISLIVAAALGATLYTAFRAKNSALAAVETTRATDLAADTFVRDIANCTPPSGVLRGIFNGVSDDVSFYTTGGEPKATVQGDMKGVEYALTQDTQGPGQILVRRVTTNLLATVQTTPADETICRNVTSMQLSYYDGTQWQDSWDSTQVNNVLPYAVKFDLELAPRPGSNEPRHTVRIIPMSCAPPSISLLGGL